MLFPSVSCCCCSNVIIEEGIKIVETAGRNPGPFISAFVLALFDMCRILFLVLGPFIFRPSRFVLHTEKFKAAGIIVVHKCVQVKHALAAEKMGADIISMVH